jgi:putative ABC transport system permease protein
MGSALLHKSVTDLTRRKARTAFAVLALAIAVASVGIFALPPLADRAMQKEIASSRLADLTVYTEALELTAAQTAALARLPNVDAFAARSVYSTRVWVGDRRVKAAVVGVPDFGNQTVDVVRITSGAAPGTAGVLSDVQNHRQGRLSAAPGDVLRVVTSSGGTAPLRVTGEGRNMSGGQVVIFESAVVLYASPETVARLSGRPGATSLEFRLRDPRQADATTAAVRDYLTANTTFTGFADLSTVRVPGDWPGKEIFNKFSQLLYVVTMLALLCALVLIGNTMTTLVGEQTREIGAMKAIGGTRRQITGIYLRTALLLGAIGSIVGIALGLVLANVLVNFFGSTFFAISGSFGVDLPIVAASLLLGLLGPPLAALPAIRRGVRVPVREALETTGSIAADGGNRVDSLLQRIGFLPRTAQIGIRSVGRRKRRSIATVFQIAFAVATLLAVLALGTSVSNLTHEGWRDHGWAIWLGSSLHPPLDAKADALIRATPGVKAAEPIIVNDVDVSGEPGFVWATAPHTSFAYDLTDGRWYGPADDRAAARVAVVESAIARTTGTQVGDSITLNTAAGRVPFRVIGIASNVQENGTVVFVPLSTARKLLRAEDGVNGYWIQSTSQDHGAIDRLNTRLEDTLTENGYQVGTELTYVGERDNVAQNRTLTTTITVLGFLIVAISMVGLISAITMSVLERTREIGILRCIGARGRDIRRIFEAEGLVLALLGWLVGIPLGYVLDHGLVWLFGELVGIEIPFVFPWANVGYALIGTLVLAVLVMLLPVRRAVRFKPGDALRYA